MDTDILITPELLREFLVYDCDSGLFTWKHRSIKHFKTKASWANWNSRFAGKPAFRGAKSEGYCQAMILFKKVFAHRAAWALHYGKWPDKHLDHINGDKSDNRICNLREASISENNRNQGKKRTNTSGYKGVFKLRSGRWQAKIGSSGKMFFLGSFDTPEEASKAYSEAAIRLHKDFARF